MKCGLSRQVFAALLGVFLALGMSLSAVRASDMAAKMATMAADMGASGQGGCNGCGGGDGSATPATCLSICMASAVAVLPPTVPVTVVSAPDLPLRKDLVSSDRASSPDPYPPRPTDLA